MDYRKHLLNLIDLYAEAKSLSSSRVTTIVMNSGSVYRSLKEGKDITVGRVESAIKWFDAHWPDDLPWPEGLARPSLSPAHSNDEAA
jgi:hypothetical protein